MNARRVHQLMVHHFPEERSAEWVYICACNGKDATAAVQSFLDAQLEGDTFLVEVHRTVGAMLSRREASAFIATHICKADIRVANREFTSVAVFARNGVASSWRIAAQPALQADVPAVASRRQARGLS